MKTLCCVAVVALLLMGVAAFAATAETDTTPQTFSLGVAEIAAIGTQGAVGDMSIRKPAKGGQEPSAAGSEGSYLQYTSIIDNVNLGAKSREITAQLTSANLPEGTNLSIGAEPTGGTGKVGIGLGVLPLRAVDLSYPAVPIINSIQNCWTGTGSKGAYLSYRFWVSDWSTVVAADSRAVTVTYTLMEAK